MQKRGMNLIIPAIVLVAFLVVGIYLFVQKGNADDVGNGASYMDISAQEAKELIDNNPNLVIIDVSPDYAEGHLPGAVNYYLGDGSLDSAIPNLDKDAMYLVYCRIDTASRQGAQKLIDAGFTNVYRLESHYGGWVAAGYLTESGASGTFPEGTETQTHEISIENFAFSPKELTVQVGDTIVWTNMDSIAHTVTSDTGNELDSEYLSKGETYSHTFNTIGNFDYHCIPHPNMQGTIIVE